MFSSVTATQRSYDQDIRRILTKCMELWKSEQFEVSTAI